MERVSGSSPSQEHEESAESEVVEPSERTIGDFIRDLRRTAQISLRELAERAGVSNPYLSQIERGLRRPSAEVLSQIAKGLRVDTALMYLRAGLLHERDGVPSVAGAIANDPDLTVAQKQSLIQIYETFRRENARDQSSERSSVAEPAPAIARDQKTEKDREERRP